MILTLKNINKKYGKKDVLSGLELELNKGECVGIIGKNGCGKSTLLSIIAGVDSSFEGELSVGDDLKSRKNIGYIPQTNPLMEHLSVYDNLWLWCDNKEKIYQVADEYNLSDILKMKVSKLSGGTKRRICLACIMAGEPGLLIMDEPTSALDIEMKNYIHSKICDFVSTGGTVLMVTHEKVEMDMCDRILELKEGRLFS